MYENLNNETLGQYITRLREEKGYSQRKLALVSGVSNTTINRIESGDTPTPDIVTLKSLAGPLGIDETELLKVAGYLNESTPPKDTDLKRKDLKQIERDLEKMMADIKSNPDDGFAAFDGEAEIDEDDLELLEDAFRTALKVVKKLNKQTYTPNKYKTDK